MNMKSQANGKDDRTETDSRQQQVMHPQAPCHVHTNDC